MNNEIFNRIYEIKERLTDKEYIVINEKAVDLIKIYNNREYLDDRELRRLYVSIIKLKKCIKYHWKGQFQKPSISHISHIYFKEDLFRSPSFQILSNYHKVFKHLEPFSKDTDIIYRKEKIEDCPETFDTAITFTKVKTQEMSEKKFSRIFNVFCDTIYDLFKGRLTQNFLLIILFDLFLRTKFKSTKFINDLYISKSHYYNRVNKQSFKDLRRFLGLEEVDYLSIFNNIVGELEEKEELKLFNGIRY